MGGDYSPAFISRFYDDYGEREWQRLDLNPRARVIFQVHLHYLRRFINGGDRVLDAGGGPGRFAIELARMDAAVTLADLSRQQLRLSFEKIPPDAEGRVSGRVQGAIDILPFHDEAFDATVCYGSPLCYVPDRSQAIAELFRVTRRGGYVLLSVSSRSVFLPYLDSLARTHGDDVLAAYFATGDMPARASGGHPMHCFTLSELQALIALQGCEPLLYSASNVMATVHDMALLETIEREPDRWRRFLANELRLGVEPGLIGAGSHIIAVLRRL